MATSQFELSIAVIATKNYLNYAANLVESINQMMESPHSVKVCLFTDNPKAFETSHLRTAVELIEVPSYGWPEATLLRYRIISDNAGLFASDLSMYIDADAIVSTRLRVEDLMESINQSESSHAGMCLVQHPGYANRSWVISRLLRFPIGPWENRSNSLAYVPFRKRNRYYCGGVFWGYTTNFLEMCSQLSEWTSRDVDNGIVAKFHDESYLNKWSVSNPHAVAGPEWAHASQLRHLRKIHPRISVLVKPRDFARQPTQ